MSTKTWHLTGPLGKRQLAVRFDAGAPADLDVKQYIELRAQYFDDLAAAARNAAIA